MLGAARTTKPAMLLSLLLRMGAEAKFLMSDDLPDRHGRRTEKPTSQCGASLALKATSLTL
jgi:hypothetical protein